jgi:hypothetical protein
MAAPTVPELKGYISSVLASASSNVETNVTADVDALWSAYRPIAPTDLICAAMVINQALNLVLTSVRDQVQTQKPPITAEQATIVSSIIENQKRTALSMLPQLQGQTDSGLASSTMETTYIIPPADYQNNPYDPAYLGFYPGSLRGGWGIGRY